MPRRIIYTLRKTMTGKQAKEVLGVVENKGFEYTFINYSTFERIKDEKFHDLREKYIAAYKKLAEYIGFED